MRFTLISAFFFFTLLAVASLRHDAMNKIENQIGHWFAAMLYELHALTQTVASHDLMKQNFTTWKKGAIYARYAFAIM